MQQHSPAEESLPGLCGALLALESCSPATAAAAAAAIPPPGVLSSRAERIHKRGVETRQREAVGCEDLPNCSADRQTAKCADSREGGGMRGGLLIMLSQILPLLLCVLPVFS